jgi:hypothetical protein
MEERRGDCGCLFTYLIPTGLLYPSLAALAYMNSWTFFNSKYPFFRVNAGLIFYFVKNFFRNKIPATANDSIREAG